MPPAHKPRDDQGTDCCRRALCRRCPCAPNLSDRILFGELWERRAVEADRSLITVASLIALDNGVTREELAEAVTHLAFYAGWPVASEFGRADPPQGALRRWTIPTTMGISMKTIGHAALAVDAPGTL